MSYNLAGSTLINNRSPFALMTSSSTTMSTASSVLQSSTASWVSIGITNNISSTCTCFHRAEFSCHSTNTAQLGGVTKFSFYNYLNYDYMHLGGHDMRAGNAGLLGVYVIGNSATYGVGTNFSLYVYNTPTPPYTLDKQRAECARSLVKRLSS